MSKSLARKTLIWSLILTVTLMGAMVFYATRKMVVIANSASQFTEADQDGEPSNVTILTLVDTDGETSAFTLKVPETVKAEDVIIDNKIADGEIWIYVDRTEALDYPEKSIEGNVSGIITAYLQEVRGGVWFKLRMNGLYECLSTLEDGVLSITIGRPKDMHDKVVAIDCDSDVISSDIAAKLEKKLEDADIRVYNLTKASKAIDASNKIDIANGIDADFYLKIQTDTDLNPDYYGVDSYYNKEFYTPELDGAVLADTIERCLVLKVFTTGHAPIGVIEDYTELDCAQIPATVMTVGYTSNPQESLLLNKESYRERIADGLYEGILEVYNREEQ